MDPTLAQYGLPGLIITVLSGVVVYQDSRNQKLLAQIAELQQARVDDAKEVRDSVAGPIQTMGAAVSLLSEKFDLASRRRDK